jgi:hypothetical protein
VSVAANVLVAVVICYNKSASLSVFDKILVNHCLIQGITALIDIPLYHVQEMFGYFPFGLYPSLVWSIYDNSINVTTNLNMLYMCWARLRCVMAPGSFSQDLLMRKPLTFMILMWLIDLSVWALIVNVFGMTDYSLNVNYNPSYVSSIFNLVFWFVPLVLIFVVALFLIYKLHEFSIRRKILLGSSQVHMVQHHDSHVSFHVSLPHVTFHSMSPHVRFVLIVVIYWFSWIIPAIESITSSTCGCVAEQTSRLFYWLT